MNKGYCKKANTHSFVKNLSQINVHTQSPHIKEYINILYPELPSLESQKKSVTPQKMRDRLDKVTGPAKKCLFSSSKKESFRKVVTNNIIMQQILKHLSSGDLYRLSQVSRSFEDAILYDVDASERFITYKKTYYSLKENYKITPPSSPEKDEQEVGSLSPCSRKHQEFREVSVLSVLMILHNIYIVLENYCSRIREINLFCVESCIKDQLHLEYFHFIWNKLLRIMSLGL